MTAAVKQQPLVLFVGFISAGKSTAAQALIDDGFLSVSFGAALKDCCAAIFRWPRHLLEGDTIESRIFRDTIDPWWAKRLGIAGFTPRYALRHVGTEGLRQHLHPDIWIATVEHQLEEIGPDKPVVVTDGRFANEIGLVRSRGGTVFRIKKGDDPVWFEVAAAANAGSRQAREAMLSHWQVHESDWSWIGQPLDGTIHNTSTIERLACRVRATVMPRVPAQGVCFEL